MSGKVTIGFVVTLGVGVAVGWALNSQDSGAMQARAQKLDQLQTDLLDSQQAKNRLESELERVRRRSSEADVELAGARTAIAEFEAESKAAAEAAAAAAKAEEEPPAPEGRAGMAFPENTQQFSFPEYDEHLKEVDWSDVGENTSKMVPALAQVIAAVKKGERPDPETQGSIQQYNGALMIVALKLNEKLPGGQANGAFTHPSVMVNSIAATLEAAGLPLSEAQLAAIGRIGTDYTQQEKKRAAAYDDETWVLQKLVEESRLKQRFFTAAFEELTDEQRDTLSPEITRGRTRVDLYSVGLLWAASPSGVPFEDRDGYTAGVQDKVRRALQLSDDQRAEADTLVSTWVSSLPNKLFVREPDELWNPGFIPADFVAEVAGYQLDLMRNLEKGLDLSEGSVKRLKGNRRVFIPYLMKEEGG